MKKVVVSAPGKVILSGEHAVVYGKPALLAAGSQRLSVTLQACNSKIKDPKEISAVRKKDRYINEIIRQVENRFNNQIKDINFGIKSEIPIGAGMGSSAALAVSLVGALLAWLGKPWDTSLISELAYGAEKYMHRNSSGSDTTISTYGGILWYRKELDFLRSFLVLSFGIPKTWQTFILVQTGRAETTGNLVNFVAAYKKHHPQAESIFNDIEQITKDMTQNIHDKNETEFRRLVILNERLLEKLGVVSDTTKKFIKEIEKAGGAAKISGTGGKKTGSGIIICSHDQPAVIEKIVVKYRFPFFQTELGGKGVRIENVII